MTMRGFRFICPVLALAGAALAQTPDVRISANALRGDLSFLASDLLEGRDSPSRGLDIAAEFIASQFRRAGLDPAGGDGYFQTATLLLRAANLETFKLALSGAGRTFAPKATEVSINGPGRLDFTDAAVFKLDLSSAEPVEKLVASELTGKIVLTEFPRGQQRIVGAAFRKLREAKPALVITVERVGSSERGSPPQLVDPESSRPVSPPRIALHGLEAAAFFDALPAGAGAATVSVRLDAPVDAPVKLRNVAGLLRGSDPALKDTYVLVSAHYDHLGQVPGGQGDHIYNGANDDGSGTVSVIELANALARVRPRPRRSVLFVTFFGEEKGLIGSGYYTRHPLFPIDKTVAGMNLEQVGRTDSTGGPKLSSASITGFDYSNVTAYFEAAGAATGVKVYKDEKGSDAYFALSDNQPLADAGIPAHSLCVAFNFPDYHGLGDEWEKIDFANMAKVDRMIALAVLKIANDPRAPHWNASNPKTARYREAREKAAAQLR